MCPVKFGYLSTASTCRSRDDSSTSHIRLRANSKALPESISYTTPISHPVYISHKYHNSTRLSDRRPAHHDHSPSNMVRNRIVQAGGTASQDSL
jgi:hypothetical protein